MNVHRWRKLEGSDPGTLEMIQKIQTLQKRLIAKTEEVVEKDLLIQEKEKLYVELKNILARQPGPEVAEQLSIYQQNLREKTRQMKAMASELNMYQAQVNEYKFEIERLTRELQDVKRRYYEQKRREQVCLSLARSLVLSLPGSCLRVLSLVFLLPRHRVLPLHPVIFISCTYRLSHSLSFSHTLSRSHTLSLVLTHSFLRALSFPPSLSLAFSLSLSLSLCRSLSKHTLPPVPRPTAAALGLISRGLQTIDILSSCLLHLSPVYSLSLACTLPLHLSLPPSPPVPPPNCHCLEYDL